MKIKDTALLCPYGKDDGDDRVRSERLIRFRVSLGLMMMGLDRASLW